MKHQRLAAKARAFDKLRAWIDDRAAKSDDLMDGLRKYAPYLEHAAEFMQRREVAQATRERLQRLIKKRRRIADERDRAAVANKFRGVPSNPYE